MKPRENCIICEGKIHRTQSIGCVKLRRGVLDITCSKQCSRIYTRISRYVHNKRRYKEVREA